MWADEQQSVGEVQVNDESTFLLTDAYTPTVECDMLCVDSIDTVSAINEKLQPTAAATHTFYHHYYTHNSEYK